MNESTKKVSPEWRRQILTMKTIMPLKLKSGTLEEENKLELRRVALWVHYISANTWMRSR